MAASNICVSSIKRFPTCTYAEVAWAQKISTVKIIKNFTLFLLQVRHIGNWYADTFRTQPFHQHNWTICPVGVIIMLVVSPYSVSFRVYAYTRSKWCIIKTIHLNIHFCRVWIVSQICISPLSQNMLKVKKSRIICNPDSKRDLNYDTSIIRASLEWTHRVYICLKIDTLKHRCLYEWSILITTVFVILMGKGKYLNVFSTGVWQVEYHFVVLEFV